VHRDPPRGDGLDELRESLLVGAPASDACSTPPVAEDDRRSLVVSFLTLLFSIPALIGA